MDVSKYRDLLIVNVNEELYVVEAPTHEADAGDLVEFCMEQNIPLLGVELSTMMGIVVDKMFCTKGEEEYRCISLLHTIHQILKIYKVRWSKEDQPEE